MTAISLEGKIFVMSTTGSVDSSLFLKFLKHLRQFIEKEWSIRLNKALIILDNASIQRSKEIVSFTKNTHWRFTLILLYMPELAPIEKYFARLKKFVIKKTAGIKINWQSTQAEDLLIESILRINENEVAKL